MQTYNIHDAKTQLSKLVEMAAKGESFVIAKAGKPMVKVVALDTPASSEMRRFGFMAGQIKVPDDFNAMGGDEIQALFEGNEKKAGKADKDGKESQERKGKKA